MNRTDTIARAGFQPRAESYAHSAPVAAPASGASGIRNGVTAPAPAPQLAEHQAQPRSGNAPVKKFRAGPISATVWNNHAKEGESEYKTVSFERNYKDKDGAWKTTTSLRMNDLPKAALVLQKAFEYLALGEGAET